MKTMIGNLDRWLGCHRNIMNMLIVYNVSNYNNVGDSNDDDDDIVIRKV